MNHCRLLILAMIVIATYFVNYSSTSTVPIIYCQPKNMVDATRERHLCVALMEWVDNPQEDMTSADTVSPDQTTKLYERGRKRQEVDHVFLRFGRKGAF